MSTNQYGKVLQYQGPFEAGEIIQVNPRQSSNTVYKIDFSIGEKDYMVWNDYDEQDNPSRVERINPIRIGGKADQDGHQTQIGEQIQIGRTYIYEPAFSLSNLRIAFLKLS